MYNRRYPIDLSQSMAVCDANYIRILKLLPDFTHDTSRALVLPALGPDEQEQSECLVEIKVEEVFRYTSTVSIKLGFSEATTPYYKSPLIMVRLYHDASTAEVVSYQEQGCFHIRAQQGDKPEFLPDEKQQVNAFLADWLILCINHGVSCLFPQQDFMPSQTIPLV